MQLVCTYILLFFIYSFLGWCMEVLLILISQKKFVNRGFLIGPYCPIYGTGALIMTIFLQKYLDDPVTLFILILLSCSVLEYCTSYFLEKRYHTRWWDYKKYRFNINGRICLETMIPFSILGMLIMYKFNPFFLSLIEKIPSTLLIVLAVLIVLILLVDNIISSKIILDIQKINANVQKKMLIKKDDTERITKLVKDKILECQKLLNKRVVHALPHVEMLMRKQKSLKRTRKKDRKGN